MKKLFSLLLIGSLFACGDGRDDNDADDLKIQKVMSNYKLLLKIAGQKQKETVHWNQLNRIQPENKLLPEKILPRSIRNMI
jgi:hypothetical protein